MTTCRLFLKRRSSFLFETKSRFKPICTTKRFRKSRTKTSLLKDSRGSTKTWESRSTELTRKTSSSRKRLTKITSISNNNTWRLFRILSNSNSLNKRVKESLAGFLICSATLLATKSFKRKSTSTVEVSSQRKFLRTILGSKIQLLLSVLLQECRVSELTQAREVTAPERELSLRWALTNTITKTLPAVKRCPDKVRVLMLSSRERTESNPETSALTFPTWSKRTLPTSKSMAENLKEVLHQTRCKRSSYRSTETMKLLAVLRTRAILALG